MVIFDLLRGPRHVLHGTDRHRSRPPRRQRDVGQMRANTGPSRGRSSLATSGAPESESTKIAAANAGRLVGGLDGDRGTECADRCATGAAYLRVPGENTLVVEMHPRRDIGPRQPGGWMPSALRKGGYGRTLHSKLRLTLASLGPGGRSPLSLSLELHGPECSVGTIPDPSGTRGWLVEDALCLELTRHRATRTGARGTDCHASPRCELRSGSAGGATRR